MRAVARRRIALWQRAGDERSTREEVFALIQAHLADELDVEPGAIGEATRFKEDLEADSLDLYTLVQELEDTYGVQDVRRAGGADPDGGGRPSTSSSPPRDGRMTGA